MLLALAGVCFSSQIKAQADSLRLVPAKPKKDWSKVNLSNRANDHFLIQFGYDGWANRPDTISIKGLSRHFNFYVMYDMPFKTSPQLSFAAGIGVGSSSIFFDNTNIDLVGKGGTNAITFKDASNSNHFKKYKLAETWLEVPLELRYVTDPLHSGKSFKVALGAKIGTMVDAHTKGKDLQNADGNSLYGSKYKEKEKSRQYFNSTRLAGTFRIGYGPFTAYASYQFISLFKENQGPKVYPFSIGLCIGGL